MVQDATVRKVGFLRFLFALLGELPSDKVYTADAGRWTDAIKWLRDRYGEQHPELFDEIGFKEAADAPAYSREVSEFLTRIQSGNMVEVSNPGYVRLFIREQAKEAIAAHYMQRLLPETREVIKRMARDLMEDEKVTLSA